METKKNLIKNVLLQLGNSTEAKYYLDQYKNSRQNKFAVVKVGGNVIETQLEKLVESITLLYYLGLTPIILHGAGPQLDAEILKRNMPMNKIDGLRVTDTETIELMQPVVKDVHDKLCHALSEAGVEIKSIFNEVFTCDFMNKDKYGYVGEIKFVNMEPINDALEQQKIPVLSCLGRDDNGNVFNINADFAIRKLVWESNPEKVIFVTPTGGLLNENSQLISAIQLGGEYESLMNEPWLHSGMKLKIQQIYQLLKPMPRKLSVSITAATELGKELFTHKGKGTFVSMGESINQYDVIPANLKLKVISLLESTFKKKLKPDFLDSLELESLFISETAQALAIITKGYNGKPYLNKFAVTPLAQGRGLGKAIWEKMLEYYPQLYWRSRSNNPINSWYFRKSDCSCKHENWISFSIGMEHIESMQCMQKAHEYQDSWEESAHV